MCVCFKPEGKHALLEKLRERERERKREREREREIYIYICEGVRNSCCNTRSEEKEGRI